MPVHLSPTQERLEKAEAEYKEAKRNHTAKLAELNILRFSELFEPYPQLESFGFELCSEYDDEGGYYWAVSANVRPSDELGSREEEGMSYNYDTHQYDKPYKYTIYVSEELEEQLADVDPDVVVALANRINGSSYADPEDVRDVQFTMEDFRRVLAEIEQ